MTDFSEFKSRFKFNPRYAYMIGVEREFFIANAAGVIVPQAEAVYTKLQGEGASLFTYELSACQIESRTTIVTPENLLEHLGECELILDRVLTGFNLQKLYCEVAPDDMPLDVYPDPSGRYAKISSAMPKEILQAACQVAGTHVHIGMPNAETALHVYNTVVPYFKELCTMGDNSSGRRLEIYRKVSPKCEPCKYDSWLQFHVAALAEGFAEEPRNCWTLIRMTKHGTIEFRMFGVAQSKYCIAQWAFACRDLCLKAVRTM